MAHRRPVIQEKLWLPLLSGLLLLLCIAYVPLSAGSILADLPEIAIPIGVTVVLAVYSLKLLQNECEVDRVKQVAISGWAGAVMTALGAWWLLKNLQRELSVTLLFDEALTVVSIGSGLGVFLGPHIINEYSSDRLETTSGHSIDRNGFLGEAVWTNESNPSPIVSTITTQISELEGVGPLGQDSLYEHVDPDVFTKLRARDDSQWQLLFYTDEYEIRVSSQGAVTIYDSDSPAENH